MSLRVFTDKGRHLEKALEQMVQVHLFLAKPEAGDNFAPEQIAELEELETGASYRCLDTLRTQMPVNRGA